VVLQQSSLPTYVELWDMSSSDLMSGFEFVMLSPVEVGQVSSSCLFLCTEMRSFFLLGTSCCAVLFNRESIQGDVIPLVKFLSHIERFAWMQAR
jgi:hypothetical protein